MTKSLTISKHYAWFPRILSRSRNMFYIDYYDSFCIGILWDPSLLSWDWPDPSGIKSWDSQLGISGIPPGSQSEKLRSQFRVPLGSQWDFSDSGLPLDWESHDFIPRWDHAISSTINEFQTRTTFNRALSCIKTHTQKVYLV